MIRQGGGICPRRDSTNARAGRVHAARARSRDATNGSGEVNDLQGLGRLRFFYDIPGEDTGRLGLGGRGKARGSSRPTSRVTTRGGGLRRHRATGRARWDRVSGCGLREQVLGFSGLIITTGGTGFSPRDLTPEATLQVLEREAPGLCEAMRSVSALGPLSRARSGTIGRSLILNTPGSPAGALESLEAVLAILPHALGVLLGEGDHHPPDIGGSTAISS